MTVEAPASDPDRSRAIAYLRVIRQRCQAASPLSTQSAPNHLQMVNLLREEYGDKFMEFLGGADLETVMEELERTQSASKALKEDWWGPLLTEYIAKRGADRAGEDGSRGKGSLRLAPNGRRQWHAVALPDSEYRLILIDDGLFGFANLACKAICRAFPVRDSDRDGMLAFSTDPDDVGREIAATPEITYRMLDFLLAYIVGGHPHMARPYLVDATHQAMADLLRKGLEIFVLAHEYGHCLAGHLTGSKKMRRALQTGDEACDVVATNWEQEHEADLIGCLLTVQVMKRDNLDIALSYWGVEAFFGCAELIERTQSMLIFGEVGEGRPSETHPPSPARCAFLRQGLKSVFGEEMATHATTLTDQLKTVFDKSWETCAPELLKLHQDGVRPAPQWMR